MKTKRSGSSVVLLLAGGHTISVSGVDYEKVKQDMMEALHNDDFFEVGASNGDLALVDSGCVEAITEVCHER